jgi:hypothetical protein
VSRPAWRPSFSQTALSPPRRTRARAGGPGRRSPPSLTSASEGGLDPALEMAVPADQRPVNELASLREAPLYSWVRGVAGEGGGRRERRCGR